MDENLDLDDLLFYDDRYLKDHIELVLFFMTEITDREDLSTNRAHLRRLIKTLKYLLVDEG